MKLCAFRVCTLKVYGVWNLIQNVKTPLSKFLGSVENAIVEKKSVTFVEKNGKNGSTYYGL